MEREKRLGDRTFLCAHIGSGVTSLEGCRNRWSHLRAIEHNFHLSAAGRAVNCKHGCQVVIRLCQSSTKTDQQRVSAGCTLSSGAPMKVAMQRVSCIRNMNRSAMSRLVPNFSLRTAQDRAPPREYRVELELCALSTKPIIQWSWISPYLSWSFPWSALQIITSPSLSSSSFWAHEFNWTIFLT